MRHVVATALLLALSSLAAPALRAQSSSPAVELANLREDVKLLQQEVRSLSLRVEQLQVENERLAKAASERSVATVAQLNTAVADLAREYRAADAATKAEILATVGTQLENLARQTNAALDAQSRSRAAAAPVAFSDNFSKEGVTYTVVAGDTVSRIAQKTGGKVADIINANKLADPTKIQVGQVLFIPGGK